MRKTRLLTLLLLLMTAVTGAWADTTVTWTASDMSGINIDFWDGEAYNNTIKGITVTSSGGGGAGACWEGTDINLNSGSTTITFASSVGNIKSIAIKAYIDMSSTPSGWTTDYNSELSWSGEASTTVSLPLSGRTEISDISEIVFTIESSTATYSVALKDGTEDAANWSVSPNPAEEGKTVTITYAGTKSVKSVTAKRKTTTGNITVYFTDAQNYGDVHVYYWNDGPNWPGTAMTEVGTNDYNQKIYRAEIPATAVGIIFNGNGSQTVDITENIADADGSWWYATDEFEGAKNKVGYVGKYTIEVTNVDDNKWTFTQPDYNVELDIEYYPAYPITISDGDVDAANWSATPTEQSVGQNVTLQYTGRKKIKRITIEAAPTARTAAEATAEDIGKLIGADGNIYADVAAATAAGTTAVAKIIYVGTTGDATYSHGLALALADEELMMNWETAKTACSNKNTSTPVTDATWLLASKEQWDYMIGEDGADGFENLRDGFNSVGGTNLEKFYYWSSTEDNDDSDLARIFRFDNGEWTFEDKGNDDGVLTRACLAF